MILKPYGLLLLLAVLLYSCSKDSVNEQTSLEVNLLGIEMATSESDNSSESGTANRAATSAASSANESLQLATIPFDQHFGITLSLSPERPQTSPLNEETSTSNTTPRAVGITQNGPQSWKLNDGIKYRLLAYDNTETKVVDTVYTVGQNSSGGLLLNSGQTYTFVLYSVLSTTQVPAAPTGKLSEAAFTSIDGNTDFIHFRKTLTLSPGRNELNVTMKHIFSQLTARINSSQVGNITSVKARVGDHYLSPTISLSNGSVLSYNSKAVNGKDITFVQTSSTSSSNESTIICNNGSSTSTLTIDEITINNITKRALSIPGLQLAPGTRYVLTLNIKSFTADQEPEIELGNSTYAPGNLVFDRNTNTYQFATSGDGDYWFKNYVKPRRTDLDARPWGENNQRPRAELNGGPGDPCEKVLPLKTWRLPNRAEMDNIRTATEAQVKGHPGPNIYAPVRYIDENYKNSGKRGMYFGVQTNPGKDAEKYLFITFSGIYNDNQNRNDTNTTGWYMLKNGNNFESMQIGPNIYTFNFYSLGDNTAVSIRCVKAG
ncbi:hypothetical protein M8998_10660 [Sphingobacterium sp. lm-10]|uniref:hypothetical protein n=1 Tax=Sphingobacterium sp. lm-10 TaxID=2944904 RepID=UPI00202010E3|nr:hypothetical protein [Sphingobacterium sp. lm-10]MCL7988400.1 hypothetical protein [Sphingobacterium sp. lm-10]